MTKIPWTFRTQVDPKREYVVAATTGLAVSWREVRKLWAFQVYTRRIIAQLNSTEGCVGFALHGTLSPLAGSTLSVWETVGALRIFQNEGSHGEAMRLLSSGAQSKLRYLQWKCQGDNLPKSWEQVFSRFGSRQT